MNRKMSGFTLLEFILVVVIASCVFMFGYRMYIILSHDADVSQVQYNVDRVFAAAAQYYQANCRIQRDPTTGVQVGTYGTLDPTYTTAPVSPYAVTIDNLRAGGYLNAALPQNRLIAPTTNNSGYIVQFNQATTTDKTLTNPMGTFIMGKVIIWTIRVGVAVRGNMPLAMVRILGADCAANANATGTTVNACGSPVSTAQTVYAVWERLPSYAAPNAEANTWMGNAEVKEFTQLYTNNNIQNGQPGPSNTDANYQNYLCGS